MSIIRIQAEQSQNKKLISVITLELLFDKVYKIII